METFFEKIDVREISSNAKTPVFSNPPPHQKTSSTPRPSPPSLRPFPDSDELAAAPYFQSSQFVPFVSVFCFLGFVLFSGGTSLFSK